MTERPIDRHYAAILRVLEPGEWAATDEIYPKTFVARSLRALSRNLSLMKDSGWVESRASTDRYHRQRQWKLTPEGEEARNKCLT